MGKVFSIGNQKGGVGKTTVTTLTAGLIYEISKANNIKFCVIDTDFQQSFYRIRETEYENLEDKENIDVYPIFSIEHITKNGIINKDMLSSIINAYDLIMIDVPGTLDFENSTQVYSVIEYIFCPIFKDYYSIESSIEFLKLCEEMNKSTKYKLKEYWWFWNQYTHNSFSKYNKGEKVFNTLFPDKKLKNNLIRSEEFLDELSTINFFKKRQFHKPSTNLYNFTAEIISIMF